MTTSVRLSFALLAVTTLFAFAGCGDDDDSPGAVGAGGSSSVAGQTQAGGASDGLALCEEIAHLCHPVDPGVGPLHECHEQSELGDAALCTQISEACLAQCGAAHDAAQGGAGGAVNGSGGAGDIGVAGAMSGGMGGAGGAGGAR